VGEAGRREFEAMFLEHADAVLAYARRRTDPDTAKEVVAEAFTVAWRRLADVPDPALPWLFGVARRSLANARRASSRQEALALRLVHEPAGAKEDAMSEVDARLSARAALDRLSPAEREAIELLAWEGLTPAEAATALGCSRGVVAVRVHRARRHLRQLTSADLEPHEAFTTAASGRAEPTRRQEAT
jgi:RNA polymerase sigma-70 factor (ECF subfamily)